ncbi:MAG: peptidylprolyl isomerase [Planctomycetota bacterium]
MIQLRRAAAALPVVLAVACTSPANRPVSDSARPIAAPARPEPAAPDAARPAPNQPASAGESTAESGAAGARSDDDVARSTPAAPNVEPARSAPSDVDDVAVSWPRSVDGTADVTIARVAGQDVPLGEFVKKWMLRYPEDVRGLLDDIVLSRIVLMESATLGLQPPPQEVDGTVRRRLELLDRQAKAAGAPDLETFIQARLGFEPRVFVQHLEEESAIDILAPRCVRAWLMSNERREVRAITVADQAGIDAVQARLARGDDFEEVAKELSTDASKEQGGRVPPLVRGDSTLARTAFAGEVGLVSGPVREGDTYLFVLVVAAPDVVEGTWEEIGDRVEASLTEQEVEDPEFWQWKEAMSARYDVDIKPFLELVR